MVSYKDDFVVTVTVEVYDGSFYLFPNPIIVYDWFIAEIFCQYAYGGHLVSIHDSEQNALVFSGGSGNRWIGIEQSGQAFVWSDSSVFTYTNWKPGQPVLGNSIQMCGFMDSSGQWDTVNCTAPKPFACKLGNF